MSDLLARSRDIDPIPSGAPTQWSAVLLLGQSWAELTILNGGTVCFARSLANDEAIESEVRRSLVMFATQPQVEPPKILYLFGQGATLQLQERLAKTLQIPVTRPRVLSEDDAPAGGVECAAGAGLLEAWRQEKLAVNFVKPKEPKPPAPSNQRLWVLAGGGALVVFALFMVVTQQMLAGMRSQISEAKSKKDAIERQLKSFDQDRIDLDGFDEWEQGTISWIDELYQISKRFPYDPPGFHLTKFDGNVLGRNNARKYPAHITLSGTNAADPGNLQREKFQNAIEDDHLQVHPDRSHGSTFTIHVDLKRPLLERFVSH